MRIDWMKTTLAAAAAAASLAGALAPSMADPGNHDRGHSSQAADGWSQNQRHSMAGRYGGGHMQQWDRRGRQYRYNTDFRSHDRQDRERWNRDEHTRRHRDR